MTPMVSEMLRWSTEHDATTSLYILAGRGLDGASRESVWLVPGARWEDEPQARVAGISIKKGEHYPFHGNLMTVCPRLVPLANVRCCEPGIKRHHHGSQSGCFERRILSPPAEGSWNDGGVGDGAGKRQHGMVRGR